MFRNLNKMSKTLTLGSCLLLIATTSLATTKPPVNINSPSLDTAFIVHPSKTTTKSITIHFYDAKTKKALGSLCQSPNEISHMRIAANLLQSVKEIYLGATESSLTCDNDKLAKNEYLGKPAPDTYYTNQCFAIKTLYKTGLVKIYPQHFTSKTPPKC